MACQGPFAVTESKDTDVLPSVLGILLAPFLILGVCLWSAWWAQGVWEMHLTWIMPTPTTVQIAAFGLFWSVVRLQVDRQERTVPIAVIVAGFLSVPPFAWFVAWLLTLI
jgi:hypothetical protein